MTSPMDVTSKGEGELPVIPKASSRRGASETFTDGMIGCWGFHPKDLGGRRIGGIVDGHRLIIMKLVLRTCFSLLVYV